MLHIGKIEKIITNNTKNNYFTATLTWLDMPGGFYNEASISAQVKISYAHVSRSFGFQYYPLPGDVIVCDFLEDGHPIILSFLSADYYNKVIDKNNYGYYFRKLVEGEYALKGLMGNEIYLDRVGSLRFITRDQEIVTNVLKTYERNADVKLTEEQKLQQTNYITTINNDGFIVNLEQQVEDYPKTEVTIGKVFDDEYKEEKKLNDESIAVQILGKTNEFQGNDSKGNAIIETKENYKIQINVEGEISISKNGKDEEGNDTLKYQISIDKEGNISLQGAKIQLDAEDIFIGGESSIKGVSLFNWCNSHTHSNGNNGSPTGNAIIPLQPTVLTQKQS